MLQVYLTSIIESIVGSVDQCPPVMRVAFKQLHKRVEEQFTEPENEVSLGRRGQRESNSLAAIARLFLLDGIIWHPSCAMSAVSVWARGNPQVGWPLPFGWRLVRRTSSIWPSAASSSYVSLRRRSSRPNCSSWGISTPTRGPAERCSCWPRWVTRRRRWWLDWGATPGSCVTR